MSKAVGTPVNFTKTYIVTGTKSGLKSSKDKSHCLSSRVVRGICQSEECFEGQTAWRSFVGDKRTIKCLKYANTKTPWYKKQRSKIQIHCDLYYFYFF